ncbi:MAG: Lar family restriction alleviation protein [Proteobacteria bacterium]|nr:Lar family restriction alleviation protein [Pseudomonadota bacterium]
MTDIQEIALLPCPFCGGSGDSDFHTDDNFIYCGDCGGQRVTSDTPEEAIEAWNTRSLSAMKEALKDKGLCIVESDGKEKLSRQIAVELCHTMERLSDDIHLLSILGSFGCTLEDSEILQLLKDYNDGERSLKNEVSVEYGDIHKEVRRRRLTVISNEESGDE